METNQLTKQKHRWLFILIGSLIVAIVFMGGYVAYLALAPVADADTNATVFVPDPGYDGVRAIEPPEPMPNFTLTDTDGEPLSLIDLNGKPALLTFGFTHCPDICPLTLQEMALIREELGALGDELHFVFISVDGERDTPAVIDRYLQALRAPFVTGLTGHPDAVRAIGYPYGVDFIHQEPDENGYYAVDHTAGMFLLDDRGQWIRRYSYGTETTNIANDLQTILQRLSNT